MNHSIFYLYRGCVKFQTFPERIELHGTFWQQILDHAIDIWYSNNVPALANHFTNHMLKQCSNRFVQTNSVCQQSRNTYLQFNCSLNLVQKLFSFDWMVHQTQSNNWSSISVVKA